VVAGVDNLREEIRTSVLRLVAEVCLRDHVASQRLGLGGTDSRFLTLLDVYGPLTPGRLAQLTGLTTGSVTGVIDRLERAGFVSRERDDADRRKVRVIPDPQATARLTAARHDPIDVLDDILHRRGADELAVIARFLGEIVEGQDPDGRRAKASNARAASGEQVGP
jgi:DNA-binding MarR family transcriptional regulator